MNDVVVVTDSAAALPEALARRWGIVVVPLDVAIDGEPAAETGDAGTEAVLVALEAGKTVTTSQPSVGAFANAYRDAAAAGARRIVSIHVSGKISGTVNGARAASADAPVPVVVIDSATVGMGTGWAALAAAAIARGGGSVDEVAGEARRVAESSTILITVDTLEYLRRGGRIPAAMAALGTALHIRPVLTVENGEVVVRDRVRTTAKARELVVTTAEEELVRHRRPGLAIMGLRAQDLADDAAAVLERRHPEIAMVVRAPVTAVLAVHGGPGAFAAVVADLPPALH